MSGPRGKESALDLAKFVDKSIRVKLAGGREGEGRSVYWRCPCRRLLLLRWHRCSGCSSL